MRRPVVVTPSPVVATSAQEQDDFSSRFTPSRGGFGLQRGPEDDEEDEVDLSPQPVFPSRYAEEE